MDFQASDFTGTHRPLCHPGLDSGPDSGLLDRLVAQGKAAALSPNTRKTYRTGWRSWAKWAEARGLPTLPAEPGHLQLWLAALWQEGKKPATLSTYLAAVAHKHRDHTGPNPAHHPQLRLLLSGLTRQAADEGNTPSQAAPLRWRHILEIIDSAHKPRRNQPGGRAETPEQAARRAEFDIAMIALAHDAALRCSELLALTWADIDLPADSEPGTVSIRRSKTDQNGQGAALPISEFTTQPLIRIRPHSARPDDPIFDISPSTVTRRMKAAAQAAGNNPANISSHSPRIGMAQDLAAHGIDLPGLMQACRWTSEAMARHYIKHLAAHHTPAAQYLKTQDNYPLSC
ncbi:tyrosine-type recombinase/integrase [Candidatus Poriferisocius sp.]|uniref:tyrosine-type recombinase/integrase n=1 Tax=Candidatus Poriferisocius sp. TaxID=3101276 RepID=UPI003B027E33